ncbi:hypothetical protein BSKO_11489 [Bryopsis sp. KO-2023]|nr:hypothetical protein BSKO_11489 [Bryopsis sp. KO-2023]
MSEGGGERGKGQETSLLKNPFEDTQKKGQEFSVKYCAWEVLKDYGDGLNVTQIAKEIQERGLKDFSEKKNAAGQVSGDLVRGKGVFWHDPERKLWWIRPLAPLPKGTGVECDTTINHPTTPLPPAKMKKHTGQRKGKPKPQGKALVGARVAVWWAGENTFFEGRIDAHHPAVDRFRVIYDDGDADEAIQFRKYDVTKKHGRVELVKVLEHNLDDSDPSVGEAPIPKLPPNPELELDPCNKDLQKSGGEGVSSMGGEADISQAPSQEKTPKHTESNPSPPEADHKASGDGMNDLPPPPHPTPVSDPPAMESDKDKMDVESTKDFGATSAGGSSAKKKKKETKGSKAKKRVRHLASEEPRLKRLKGAENDRAKGEVGMQAQLDTGSLDIKVSTRAGSSGESNLVDEGSIPCVKGEEKGEAKGMSTEGDLEMPTQQSIAGMATSSDNVCDLKEDGSVADGRKSKNDTNDATEGTVKIEDGLSNLNIVRRKRSVMNRRCLQPGSSRVWGSGSLDIRTKDADPGQKLDGLGVKNALRKSPKKGGRWAKSSKSPHRLPQRSSNGQTPPTEAGKDSASGKVTSPMLTGLAKDLGKNLERGASIDMLDLTKGLFSKRFVMEPLLGQLGDVGELMSLSQLSQELKSMDEEEEIDPQKDSEVSSAPPDMGSSDLNPGQNRNAHQNSKDVGIAKKVCRREASPKLSIEKPTSGDDEEGAGQSHDNDQSNDSAKSKSMENPPGSPVEPEVVEIDSPRKDGSVDEAAPEGSGVREQGEVVDVAKDGSDMHQVSPPEVTGNFSGVEEGEVGMVSRDEGQGAGKTQPSESLNDPTGQTQQNEGQNLDSAESTDDLNGLRHPRWSSGKDASPGEIREQLLDSNSGCLFNGDVDNESSQRTGLHTYSKVAKPPMPIGILKWSSPVFPTTRLRPSCPVEELKQRFRDWPYPSFLPPDIVEERQNSSEKRIERQ